MRYVPRALGIVWAAAPGLTIASVVLLAAQGLLPVLTVYLTRSFVNALLAAINSAGARPEVELAGLYAALMGLVMLATQLLTVGNTYAHAALAERVQDRMNRLIHTHISALDLQFFESPSYFDQLQRASVDAIDRPLALLDGLSGLVQSTITLVAMAGVLVGFAWWMPIPLVIGTLPALWVALAATGEFHRWRTRNTISQRRLAYYHQTLVSSQAAAELRLFDLGSTFSDAYDRLRRRLHGERLALMRKQSLQQVGAGLCSLLALSLALIWAGWHAFRGSFSLGDLAMFSQAIGQGLTMIQRLLTGAGDVYRNLAYLEDLFAFLEMEPVVQDPASPVTVPPSLRHEICLERVTFGYPGSETTALNEFSLEIPAGQIVAIVGENGAGKSTLLKLLCRFYDPQQGRITWDGVDLRQMAQADLRRRITVLFQLPYPYHDTAADNIAFGDLAGAPTRQQIERAAADGGAADIIARLPDGYDTVLGKWFGNADLSVGEWQRLALARAFVRQADLVILDEPTSAMDSWAEAAWMSRFRSLVAGRTALIITHRFTTAMQADMIHVMHHGVVVESGSHAGLVALGGRYAGSWRQQMREGGRDGAGWSPAGIFTLDGT